MQRQTQHTMRCFAMRRRRRRRRRKGIGHFLFCFMVYELSSSRVFFIFYCDQEDEGGRKRAESRESVVSSDCCLFLFCCYQTDGAFVLYFGNAIFWAARAQETGRSAQWSNFFFCFSLSLSLSLEYSTAQHSTTLDVVMLLLASGVDFNQLCSRRIQFPGRFSLLLLRPMLQPTISLSTQYFLSFFLLSFFCAPFSSFARKEGRASLGRRANNRRSNREKIKMSQSTMRTEWSQVEYWGEEEEEDCCAQRTNELHTRLYSRRLEWTLTPCRLSDEFLLMFCCCCFFFCYFSWSEEDQLRTSANKSWCVALLLLLGWWWRWPSGGGGGSAEQQHRHSHAQQQTKNGMSRRRKRRRRRRNSKAADTAVWHSVATPRDDDHPKRGQRMEAGWEAGRPAHTTAQTQTLARAHTLYSSSSSSQTQTTTTTTRDRRRRVSRWTYTHTHSDELRKHKPIETGPNDHNRLTGRLLSKWTCFSLSLSKQEEEEEDAHDDVTAVGLSGNCDDDVTHTCIRNSMRKTLPLLLYCTALCTGSLFSIKTFVSNG